MGEHPLRRYLPAAAAVGCVFALVVLLKGHPSRTSLDGGEIEPIYAASPERIVVRSLPRGGTLGQVLEDAVGVSEQDELLTAFRAQASPRSMLAGTEITLRYRSRDDWLRGVDVRLSPDETVRLARSRRGWTSSKVHTPVFTDTVFVSGVIEDALWNAVVGNPALEDMPSGDRARLIYHLDNIFQWQIDFSRQIRSGDFYRFAFERRVRPDGSMRGGHVVAAELVNAGTSFHAIWFDAGNDGEGTYYDLEGNSVRRAFLMKPLEFRHISSRFSNARYHPILQRWRAHRGVDYAADAGTPIMATADGVVTIRGPTGGLGNAIEIRHTNGYRTRYGHMSRFASGISVGSRVRQSQVIGYVGMTGLATGPHLHYEMYRNGDAMDPLSLRLPAGEPIPGAARARWTSELLGRLALLEVLPGPEWGRHASDEPSGDDDETGVRPSASSQERQRLEGS